MTWITNCPAAAEHLKAADKAYNAARKAATDLPLAEKVVALRNAKAALAAAYCPVAVNKAIEASNRAGRKIGKREAKLIHRLLKGR